jgi:hypothetical protein
MLWGNFNQMNVFYLLSAALNQCNRNWYLTTMDLLPVSNFMCFASKIRIIYLHKIASDICSSESGAICITLNAQSWQKRGAEIVGMLKSHIYRIACVNR